jgi:hypothetical protein
MAKQTSEAFENDLVEVEDDLANDLENQHKLFLPAVGIFLMKDAIFNARGDFIQWVIAY